MTAIEAQSERVRCQVDLTGRMLQCDDKLYEWLGRSGESGALNLLEVFRVNGHALTGDDLQAAARGRLLFRSGSLRLRERQATGVTAMIAPDRQGGAAGRCLVVFWKTEVAPMSSDTDEFPVQALFEANPQPMWVYDRKTRRFLAVNEAAIQTYGYSREEFLGMRLDDIRPPEDRDKLAREIAASEGAGYRVSPGWRHLTRDGRVIHVEIHSQRIRYRGHDAALVSVHDVTRHHELAMALERSNAYFRQLFDNSPEAIAILDMEDRVQDINPAFQTLFGYTPEEARGRSMNELIVPDDLRDEAEELSSQAAHSGVIEHETIRRDKQGKRLDVAIKGYPILIDGRQQGIYGIYRDITEKRRMLEKITFQATHDALTELVNRHEFENRTRQLLARSRRDGSRHALLYLDLDQFKVINDTCGHTAGDELLRQLAHRLRKRLRATDTLARLGGDEFGLLLTDCRLEDAERVAREYIELVRSYRFQWRDKGFVVGASVGLVELTADSGSLLDVLSAADAACYTAKERGRNRVQVYSVSDETLQRHRSQMDWVARLNRALEENRFRLFYQRIEPLGVRDDTPHYEIFIRMVDESGELVTPAAFIPAAERYNLMPQIDRWVIERVFEGLREEGEQRGVVCINVSGTSLSDDGFVDFVQGAYERYGIDPARVCFEITETAAVSDLARALQFINEVRERGSAVALDDFGSGMSSFTYLQSMNVDYLKIDGSFIRDIMKNPVDQAMTEAINRVGQVMGLRTIAEFVESAEIRERLRELGVDYVQGYAIHRPELWHEEPGG